MDGGFTCGSNQYKLILEIQEDLLAIREQEHSDYQARSIMHQKLCDKIHNLLVAPVGDMP